MHSRVQSSAGKSNNPINTTLVARQQTAQPVNAPKSGLSDPKFNFNLSNIPISAPVQPQEEDEAEKQLQKQELQKSKLQQQPSNLPGKLSPKSGSSIHLNKMLISAPQRSFNTPPLQPKLKVRIAPRNRLQQQITEKREEEPSEELSTKAFASSSNPSDNPGQDNPESGTNRTSAMGHSLANIAISSPGTYSPPPPSPLIQPKLTISTPGDKYEQEADTVSARVVEQINTPNFAAQGKARFMEPNIRRPQPLAPRQSALKVTPSKPKKLVHPIPTSTPWIERMTAFTSRRTKLTAPANLETSIQQAKGGGQPIADNVREPMEQAFDADFSGVNIHTDSQANQLNNTIQSRAFTTGQDIFFRQGEYNPENREGQGLLAHELTHVVQQTGGRKLQKAQLSEPQIQPVPGGEVEEIKTNNNTTVERASLVESKAQQKLSPHKLTDMLGENGTALEPKSINTISRKANKIQFKVAEKSSDNIEQIQQEESEQQTSEIETSKQKENQTGSPATSENSGEKASSTQAKEETKPQKQTPSAKTQTKQAQETKPTQETSILSEEQTDTEKIGEAGEKAPSSPEEDPAFQGVVTKSKKVTQQQKEHPPATKEADEAQAAAKAPPNEVESKAQDNQVGEMEGAKTPGFDAAGFKAKLMKRIEEMAPKNLEEADNFKDNNQLDGVKQELGGQVDEEKQKSQGELEEKAQETPDTSGIEAKKVSPLPPQEPGAEPGNINAEQATPKEKGQGEVEAPLQNSSKEIDQKLAENNVTEQQLAKSNEPQFIQTLEAKKTAQTHAKEAPKTYRQSEQEQIAQAQGEAAVLAQEKLQGMHGDRLGVLEQVAGNQLTGKSNDEQARSKVAGEINAIYEDTKVNVEKILSELDSEVGNKFDKAAEEGKKLFENYVGRKMDAYKAKRYSGFWGPGKWLKDKLFGMPSEVNKFYEEGRQKYLDKMNGAIDNIVNFIGTKLTAAKQEVAKGKQKIQDYVNQLPQDLKAVGTEAAADIQSNFNELEQSIDNKQDELIDTLAQKYQDNLQAIDARIEEMKEANKGLVTKAIDFVVEVVGTMIKMAELLAKVLARAASAIPKILQDPIGFLGNLVSALKQGFQNFMSNIGKHLKKGLLGWLTGTLASGGIQLPNKLDLSGIFSLVVQLLGMGYEAIRARAVKKLGEEKVSKLEQTFEIFKILATQGVQGLWQFVKDKLGDLKAMVLDPIRDFIIENVIKAGITWVLSLLNPASAFVKACQAIYQIVMFFMERAEQIADFINAIIDAVLAIAGGAIGKAIKGVENALAKAVPLVIAFLARLLGLGNIAGKVQDILRKLRKPIVKAIDWILDKAVKFARKMGSKFGKKGKKKEDKTKEDKTTKNQVEDKRSDRAKNKDLEAAQKKMQQILSKSKTTKEVESYFPAIKKQFGLKKLEWNKLGTPSASIIMEVNPKATIDLTKTPLLLNEGDTSHSNKFKQKVTFTQGTIDGQTVGKVMEAEKLGPNHPQGGPPSSSSLKDVMKYLPTDPKLDNDKKYIKGHLLNDNLGGPGEDTNLYPITATANKQHENTVESLVKQWVNKEGFWVYYKVEVKEKKVDLNKSKSKQGSIKADFICEANKLDADGRRTTTGAFKTTIHSEFSKSPTSTSGTVVYDKNAKSPTADKDFDKNKVEESSAKSDTPVQKLDSQIADLVKDNLDTVNSLESSKNKRRSLRIGGTKKASTDGFIEYKSQLQLSGLNEKILTIPGYTIEKYAESKGKDESEVKSQWNSAVTKINNNKQNYLNKLNQALKDTEEKFKKTDKAKKTKTDGK